MIARSRRPKRAKVRAFTLLEMMIVLAIIAILATIGVPIYHDALDDAETMNAVGELRTVSNRIDRYIAVHGHPPDTLADVGLDGMRDQWGNPYQYLRIDNLSQKDQGNGDKVRKDRNLHPINTDYDLYSMGPDGRSVAPLTSQPSRDDIIRAKDGSFFGLAVDY